MSLPQCFCWSRFGTEAGEEITAIIRRKETERFQNGGIFLWGIGNALTPSIRLLTELEREPEVIFSPIRSAPKQQDVAPRKIAHWTSAKNLDGKRYLLPSASIVTSRAKEGRTQRHYALVCASRTELKLESDLGEIVLGNVRNLITNNPIGASQVTAVVRQSNCKPTYSNTTYKIAMRFRLAAPYFVELDNPIIRSAA